MKWKDRIRTNMIGEIEKERWVKYVGVICNLDMRKKGGFIFVFSKGKSTGCFNHNFPIVKNCVLLNLLMKFTFDNFQSSHPVSRLHMPPTYSTHLSFLFPLSYLF